MTRAKRIHWAVKEYYNSDTNTSMKPCTVRISKVYAVSIQLKNVTFLCSTLVLHLLACSYIRLSESKSTLSKPYKSSGSSCNFVET